ncbi:MAG: homogentisate 1,2-dioxygenase [Myxococcales bacterium]|nr:homogentisate 1,2-dioxygenase [Myxococcota bacterium]MDW8282464.1 homogentisate 1,2-dioxygenase [Myxococcales bacterium]
MLERACLGLLPRKHHTVLRDEQGRLCYEHCLTRQGFEGPYTILYQRSLPPRDAGRRPSALPPDPPPAPGVEPLRRRHLRAGLLAQGGDFLQARHVLLQNSDVAIAVCRPDSAAPRYLLNGDGDELYFVHEGHLRLESLLGPLELAPGDYALIPRGVLYRLVPAGPAMLFLVEARSYLEIPRSFRNAAGQLRMDAPYCHRDVRRPRELPQPGEPLPEGGYLIIVKRGGRYHEVVRNEDPFDVLGWDGAVYPLALSIHDYQAKVGRVHLPPTTFTTFAGGGLVVCSFVPRPLDYDPEAVPCPYPHSSVHCDEVIFYVSGTFTSRRGIGPGSISHHPSGLPHGPQPGAYEASIGRRHTEELAVMVDTFQPLVPTVEAAAIEDLTYHDSWAAPAPGERA